MKHSDAPHRELRRARRAADAMKELGVAPEVLDHWEDFLNALFSLWEKAKDHYGKSPKWKKMETAYWNQIKTDPLLSYLYGARGARVHRAEKLLQIGVDIESYGTNRKPIFNLWTNADGTPDLRNTRFGLTQTLNPETKPVEIVDRRAEKHKKMKDNTVYPVPRLHFGKHVNPNDLGQLAELAIAFYAGLLDKAEVELVDED